VGLPLTAALLTPLVGALGIALVAALAVLLVAALDALMCARDASFALPAADELELPPLRWLRKTFATSPTPAFT
jgi:hypothetical protein